MNFVRRAVSNCPLILSTIKHVHLPFSEVSCS